MEKRIQKLFSRWGPPLPAFCQLLLGQDADAEKNAVEAFHAYMSRNLDLDLAVLPALLFAFAVELFQRFIFSSTD